jgi:hypothetical protein
MMEVVCSFDRANTENSRKTEAMRVRRKLLELLQFGFHERHQFMDVALRKFEFHARRLIDFGDAFGVAKFQECFVVF